MNRRTMIRRLARRITEGMKQGGGSLAIGQLKTALARLSGARRDIPRLHRETGNSVARRFLDMAMRDLGEADVHLKSALKSITMDGY